MILRRTLNVAAHVRPAIRHLTQLARPSLLGSNSTFPRDGSARTASGSLLCNTVRRTATVVLRQQRLASTVTHVEAKKDAPREVPTPVVFVSASRWTGEPASSDALKAFEQHLTRHGWNVTHIDVDIGDAARSYKTSDELLGALEADLASQMRNATASGPFPPIMIATGMSTMIVEQYVSSHPLSGLVLIDPPLSPSHAREEKQDLLPTPLKDFTYEIRFPAITAWTQERVEKLAYWDVHRIESAREDEADESLARLVWDINSEADEHGSGPHEMRKWAEDECGINDASETSVLEVDMGSGEKGGVDDILDEAVSHKEQHAPAPELPAWFVEGTYERSKTGSKKEPLSLNEAHIEESFIRGSGPGGQAINKLATCVQLKHVPTGIVLKCQETRDRRQNRVIARRRLSRDLEYLVFGRDSVVGRDKQRNFKRKAAKGRKQARKAREQQKEAIEA